MMFGGMFKKWFGGGSRKRAARLTALAAVKTESDDHLDDNLPGADSGGDPGTAATTQSLLVFDRNGDGVIDPATEITFLEDTAGATTNFKALEGFDSNADHVFDINDPQFLKFGVWTDKNKDGQFQTGEFETLSQLGIVSIDLSKGLTSGSVSVTRADGSQDLLKLTAAATGTL